MAEQRSHNRATPTQFAEFSAIVTIALPKAISGFDIKELIRRYAGNYEVLSRALRAALAEGPRQTQADDDQQSTPAEPQPSHADIRIKRVIGGEEIWFIGFLRDDDEDGYVIGNVSMDRVRAAGFEPIEGSGHLKAHLDEWADDPELNPYYVVMDELPPRPEEANLDVLLFHRFCRRNWISCLSQFDGFGRSDLVACRAAPQPYIRITRVIGGKEIVFIGLIRDDDDKVRYVTSYDMLRRLRVAGFTPIEDSGHLEAHRDEWVDDPELAPYFIVTGEEHPWDNCVRYFGHGNRKQGWNATGRKFSRDALVACCAR